MGTSRNDPSPSTPPWKMARTILGQQSQEPDRQARQLWMAALRDTENPLFRELASPGVAAGCRIAEERLAPAEAIKAFTRAVTDSREAGLAVDLAKRALVRTASQGGDAGAYGREVFAEAVSYYAARDLPSVIGAAGKISTASEAVALKEALRADAKAVLASVAKPTATVDSWTRFVEASIAALVKPRGAR